MIDEMPQHILHLPFHFYFDNLFTDISLLNNLRDHGYIGTSTNLENHIPKTCLITRSSTTKKWKRFFEQALSKVDNFIIVRWVDNTFVSIASIIYGVIPKKNITRYLRAEKRMQVHRPYVLEQYNKFVGSTDRMDDNIAKHKIGIKSKKWWWSIFRCYLFVKYISSCVHSI